MVAHPCGNEQERKTTEGLSREELESLVEQIPQAEFGNRLVGVAVHATILHPIPPRVGPYEDSVGLPALLSHLLLPTAARTPPQGYVRKAWTFEDSVFSEWNVNEEEVTAMGFEEDWRLSKIRKIIKDDVQKQDLKEYIRPFYKTVKAIFKRCVVWRVPGDKQPFLLTAGVPCLATGVQAKAAAPNRIPSSGMPSPS